MAASSRGGGRGGAAAGGGGVCGLWVRSYSASDVVALTRKRADLLGSHEGAVWVEEHTAVEGPAFPGPGEPAEAMVPCSTGWEFHADGGYYLMGRMTRELG